MAKIWRLAALLVFLYSSLVSAKDERKTQTAELQSALHVPVPPPKLQDKFYGKVTPSTVPGLALDRVSFATAYSLRVPALVYHAAGPTISRHPALVLVSSPGDDKSSALLLRAAVLYAQAGSVVLTYDSLGEFERHENRLSGAAIPDAFAPQDPMAARLLGLQVADVLQALNYLSGRRDVDSKHLAIAGVSPAAELACALDDRLRACLLAQSPPSMQAFVPAPALTALLERRSLFRAPSILSKAAALWLTVRLPLPAWTRGAVEKMSETAHSVDPLPTPGSDAPAIARDQLHALPEVIWDADSHDYLYATFVDRARAAVRSGAP